jgi:DNA-binding response OmpR family regulator
VNFNSSESGLPITTSEQRYIKMLIVEDDKDLAALFLKQFKRLGYNITHLDNGEDAMKTLTDDVMHFDIVLLDYMLGGLSGLDILEKLPNAKRPPVIVMTGMGSEEVAVTAMKLGASDYVVKDASRSFIQRLPVVVEDALQKHQQSVSEKHRITELERVIKELHRQLVTEKDWEEFVTVCAWSQKIKFNHEWLTLPQYLEQRFGLEVTHGIASDVAKTLREKYGIQKSQP